jgi:uncharacterized integral membrane protein
VSFFRTARNAAAAEYGRNRAEKYGRVAGVWRAVKVGFWCALLVLVVIATLTHRG